MMCCDTSTNSDCRIIQKSLRCITHVLSTNRHLLSTLFALQDRLNFQPAMTWGAILQPWPAMSLLLRKRHGFWFDAVPLGWLAVPTVYEGADDLLKWKVVASMSLEAFRCSFTMFFLKIRSEAPYLRFFLVTHRVFSKMFFLIVLRTPNRLVLFLNFTHHFPPKKPQYALTPAFTLRYARQIQILEWRHGYGSCWWTFGRGSRTHCLGTVHGRCLGTRRRMGCLHVVTWISNERDAHRNAVGLRPFSLSRSTV